MCAKRGGVAPSALVKLDMFRRVREMIFAANDVRDFHLDVVDHVDEMKNPGAVRPADGHVGMRARIGEIEIDLAADEIVDNDVLARRTEAQRALVFENVAGVLKFLSDSARKFRCARFENTDRNLRRRAGLRPNSVRAIAILRKLRRRLLRCCALCPCLRRAKLICRRDAGRRAS